MESLTGETQKKRVVRSSAYMHEKTLTPAINCYSATFLIRTSEGFIMVRVIRQCLEMPDGYVLTGFIYRMKPTRVRMCHALVMNYGLYKKMEIFVRPCFSKLLG